MVEDHGGTRGRLLAAAAVDPPDVERQPHHDSLGVQLSGQAGVEGADVVPQRRPHVLRHQQDSVEDVQVRQVQQLHPRIGLKSE
jgi:hypothetical protein